MAFQSTVYAHGNLRFRWQANDTRRPWVSFSFNAVLWLLVGKRARRPADSPNTRFNRFHAWRKLAHDKM